MKKILFGLAALSAMAFGETTPSTGVHNSVYGNNQIDVETRAFIINSGLVITASEGTVAGEGANNPIIDAIKKAVLDHGTLMAGTSATSEVARTVYVRKTNGTNFPVGTVLNIALNADALNTNNLKHTTDNANIAHKLDAYVNGAIYDAGSGNNTGGAQTLTLSGEGDENKVSAGDFEVKATTHNIPIELKSTINSSAIGSSLTEGQYTNTSTLAVRFSKIPSTTADAEYKADYKTAGDPTTGPGTDVQETAGIKADGKPGVSTLAKR